MKIIFDSEITKERFVHHMCPCDFDLKDLDYDYDAYACNGTCDECWKQSGAEIRVEKEESCMKKIFDSESEKDAFMSNFCPGVLGLNEFETGTCCPSNCDDCWKKAGCELAVQSMDDSLKRIADGLENIYGLMLKSEQCRLKNEINSLKFEQEKQRLFQAFENGGKTDD